MNLKIPYCPSLVQLLNKYIQIQTHEKRDKPLSVCLPAGRSQVFLTWVSSKAWIPWKTWWPDGVLTNGPSLSLRPLGSSSCGVGNWSVHLFKHWSSTRHLKICFWGSYFKIFLLTHKRSWTHLPPTPSRGCGQRSVLYVHVHIHVAYVYGVLDFSAPSSLAT